MAAWRLLGLLSHFDGRGEQRSGTDAVFRSGPDVDNRYLPGNINGTYTYGRRTGFDSRAGVTAIGWFRVWRSPSPAARGFRDETPCYSADFSAMVRPRTDG